MTWTPDHEVYCPVCTRMVAARVEKGRVVGPAVHFRYSDSDYHITDVLDPRTRFVIRCAGAHTRGDAVTGYGSEDPAAAFYLDAVAHLAASTTVVSQLMIRISGATTSASSPSAKLRWWNRS